MLDFMRRSVNSIFIKALLVLLIASFAMWGIGDVFKAGGNTANVATVGESEISAPQFQAEFAQELQRMQQMLGSQITREQGVAMGLGGMLVNRLTSTALISESAKDMGLYVSQDAIIDVIQSSPSFQNDAGVFDRRVFTALLSRNGLNEEEYINRLRQDISGRQVLSPISSGATPPKALIDALYAVAAEKRVLDVVRISHGQLKNVPQPTSSDLSTYHTDNSANFMSPEYRGISALILNTDDIAATIDISADDLQEAFDDQADTFSTPEKRTLQQILVSDEETAKRAASLLATGVSFGEVAKTVKANPAMVNIGDMTRADTNALAPEIAEATFSTAKGANTSPVKTPLGWHIFQVTNIIAGTQQTLADVKDTLVADLKETRATDALYALSNELEDLLGGGMTLEEAASALNVAMSTVPAIDAAGKAPDGNAVELAFASDILRASAKLGEGVDSPLSESADGKAFFVVRMDSIKAPILRPLESVKKAVTDAWMTAQKTKMAADTAKTVQTRLEAGESAAAIAKALGFASFVTTPFTRSGDGLEKGALPSTAVTQAFSLTQGGVMSEEGTGAHTVARLQSIQSAPKTSTISDNALYTSIVNQESGRFESDLSSQMAEALQVRFPIVIYQNVLNDIY